MVTAAHTHVDVEVRASDAPARAPAGRRATIAAQGGLCLLALHAVDDNFLQPSSGTSAADHLLSGLTQVGLLLAVVALIARLRLGVRGAVSIPLGLLGLIAGLGEAGYSTVGEGPSGDDFTGLLAIPAGLVVLGAGIALLWTSRWREGRRVWRYVRRAGYAVAAVVALYVVVFPLAIAYVFTHSATETVPEARLGAAYENVAFTTHDGLTLRGWYVPSRNRAAMIAAPGRGDSQRLARMLVRHGYGVLLFDRRGEGASDGDPNIFGWEAAGDLRAAVEFLQRRADVDPARIGGIGLSVGGEAMLQAAAESDGLAAVVSDGAGSRSIREDLERPGQGKWGEIPTSVVITAGTWLFSNHAPPPGLVDLVPRISPRPVLFIYGEHDQANVVDLTPHYYAVAGQPKSLWRVPGAGHTEGSELRPRAYERRVTAFLDHALLGDRGGAPGT
jgi:dienelactone hydrolase